MFRDRIPAAGNSLFQHCRFKSRSSLFGPTRESALRIGENLPCPAAASRRMNHAPGSLPTESRLEGPDVLQFRWSESAPTGNAYLARGSRRCKTPFFAAVDIGRLPKPISPSKQAAQDAGMSTSPFSRRNSNSGLVRQRERSGIHFKRAQS